jgi:caa(3)-type oxidase subunit IV
MSEPAPLPVAAAAAPHGESHRAHYLRIWGILVVLLVISVAGPFLGIRAVTLVTAFGVAGVKAYLVARNFMHLDVERRIVLYLVAAMLAIMVVMVGGISPDVLRHDGRNWENVAAKAAVERGEHEAAAAGTHE